MPLSKLNSASQPASVSFDGKDSGLACLVLMARFHGVAVSASQLLHQRGRGQDLFTPADVLLSARSLGLMAKAVKGQIHRLAHYPLPALLQDNNGGFFILAACDGDTLFIHDAQLGRQKLSLQDFVARWSGLLILMRSQASIASDLARFDFTWFIPAIVKYRKLLGEVLLASFALQLFALLTPLFFQVVMDKVLVHHSTTTLNVIVIGLLAIMLFESMLSALRSYVFSHTTSRIDVELSSKLFAHLLALPIAWFQARRVGDSVARVRELETIRSFLTGNAITLLLDMVFSVVFIGVMLFYSGWLTLIVIASLPIYFLISLLITPPLRARLQESFNRGAENQALLVEAVSGMDTVKALSVKPQLIKRWDNQQAAYIAASFRTQVLSTFAGESVNLVGKLVTAATLWMGAHLVMSGSLSVGQLIAFNMLAGRVAQPIIRLAQLWINFQQTGVSLQRLGDILNSTPEYSNQNKSVLPRLTGHIELDQVHFRYRADGSEILRGINLIIEPNEVIGIVGRSGSGKSTLTRLIQRFYTPQGGRVLVDGMDLALADVSSLRRQIGVVLQENTLFNRSIRENIALTDPGAPIERVIKVAQLAGAHEFILELPEGYDTLVGEHGASLSGGQRQRIAIARALIGNPRILIFDEATSALDYESERIIQQNMQAICKGRTVIIIAHRLSAVRHSNRIIVMERGQIVESGPHQQLLQKPNGHYRYLHQLQQG